MGPHSSDLLRYKFWSWLFQLQQGRRSQVYRIRMPDPWYNLVQQDPRRYQMLSYAMSSAKRSVVDLPKKPQTHGTLG